jgi:hypothetical protein
MPSHELFMGVVNDTPYVKSDEYCKDIRNLQ